MFLAAREIKQRERELRIADHAQVGLNSARQQHAGFGLAFGNDIEDAGLLREAAQGTLDVGDGTTTSTLLAFSRLAEGPRNRCEPAPCYRNA